MTRPWSVKPMEAHPMLEAGVRDLSPASMEGVRMHHVIREGSGELEPLAGETLLLTLSGRVQVEIDGDRMELEQHDFLYLQGGVPCRWRALSDEPWSFVRVLAAPS
jgi:uncharacterized RmlC-like cupin family protein